jgi:large subunit ribosomal protein L7/L12
MNHEDFIKQIESMSVSELNDLVKALEEKFGVSAAAFAASAGAGQVTGEESTEDKDAYTVILKDPGGAKIQVIKALRDITGQGLKEAKEMADKAPTTVKEGVKKDEAEEIKKKLEDAGGIVEMK